MHSRITGSGSYIPSRDIPNAYFDNHLFLQPDGTPFPYNQEEITRKFKAITGIERRRYVEDHLEASDIGAIAAQHALKDASCDPETLDYLIVAHNFGDVRSGAIQSDILPSLASRIKQKLGIHSPKCVAYDLLFGCPGWLEGMIQAQAFIKAGMAKKCLVIGTETLSRVLDPHDRDSMIFADGAGATVVEATDGPSGVLGFASASHTLNEAGYLHFGPSNDPGHHRDVRYIKMLGRKIYEFSLKEVPQAMKTCLDSSGVGIESVKKVLIHQANEKMDEAIIQRFYKLYGEVPPPGIMPMSIHYLGNSSVATVPTLLDLLLKGKLEGHSARAGDVLLLASVGAGMHINAMTVRI